MEDKNIVYDLKKKKNKRFFCLFNAVNIYNYKIYFFYNN